MELPLAVVAPGRARADVQVRADERATVGQVAALLGGAVSARHGEPLFVDGRPLDPNLPLARLPLGTVVGVGGPVADAAPPAIGLEVAVVGGPCAGLAVPLDGDVLVGRDADATLRLAADADVSRRHCFVSHDRATGGVVLQDAGSSNGAPAAPTTALPGPAPASALPAASAAGQGAGLAGRGRGPGTGPELDAGGARDHLTGLGGTVPGLDPTRWARCSTANGRWDRCWARPGWSYPMRCPAWSSTTQSSSEPVRR